MFCRLQILSQIDKETYKNTSYEEDDDIYPTGIFDFIKNMEAVENEENKFNDIDFKIENIPAMDIFSQNSLYYIAGYICNSIAKYCKNCCEKKCLSNYILDEPHFETYSFLTELRDYNGTSLVYVNHCLFLYFVQMANIFLNNFEKLASLDTNLSKIIITLFNKIDINIGECSMLKVYVTKKITNFLLKISSTRRKRPQKDYSSYSLSSII